MAKIYPSLISLKEEIKKSSPEQLLKIKKKLSYLTAITPYDIFIKDQNISNITKENLSLKVSMEESKKKTEARVSHLENQLKELTDLKAQMQKENLSSNKAKEEAEGAVAKIKEEISLVKEQLESLKEENSLLKSHIQELESISEKEVSDNIISLEDYKKSHHEEKQLSSYPSLLIIQGDKSLTDKIKQDSLVYAKTIKQPIIIENCSINEKISLSNTGELKHWNFSVILGTIKRIRKLFSKKNAA